MRSYYLKGAEALTCKRSFTDIVSAQQESLLAQYCKVYVTRTPCLLGGHAITLVKAGSLTRGQLCHRMSEDM